METTTHPDRATVGRVEQLDVISLADIIDRPVRGPDGTEVGTVTNVYADLVGHQLRYALIEVGGFLGIGARPILVPFAVLSWTDDDLVLPVAREVLEEAPAWDEAAGLAPERQAQVVTYWSGEREDHPTGR